MQLICNIFGFVTKTVKTFLVAWKVRQENPTNYFTKHYSAKHHKRVRRIYLHTDKTPRSVPLILLKPEIQGYVDPVDSKMEEFRETFTIP